MNYIKKLLVFVTRYFTSWALTCGIAWVLFKIFTPHLISALCQEFG